MRVEFYFDTDMKLFSSNLKIINHGKFLIYQLWWFNIWYTKKVKKDGTYR